MATRGNNSEGHSTLDTLDTQKREEGVNFTDFVNKVLEEESSEHQSFIEEFSREAGLNDVPVYVPRSGSEAVIHSNAVLVRRWDQKGLRVEGQDTKLLGFNEITRALLRRDDTPEPEPIVEKLEEMYGRDHFIYGGERSESEQKLFLGVSPFKLVAEPASDSVHYDAVISVETEGELWHDYSEEQNKLEIYIDDQRVQWNDVSIERAPGSRDGFEKYLISRV